MARLGVRGFVAMLALFACRGPVPLDAPPKDSGETSGDADDDTSAPPDPTEAVYDPAHLLVVEIEIDASDWRALTSETRDFWDTLGGVDCQAQPFESPFHWYPADVTLDGVPHPLVGVRKKGFLGSLSSTKPALKVDLGRFGEPRDFSGVRDFTLNNALQDPSLVRQCLGYGFYRDAGIPASRCNFARVFVNGRDLGLYANVEPIKEGFLERNFGSTEGNLYEGTLSDFAEGWTGTFGKKNNEDEADFSDIEAVVEALKAPDDALLAALDPVLDVDAFLTHWAAEVVSTHLDGYANNTNNFYLYHDPASGRLRFIPWGIDGVLQTPENLEDSFQSVYAWGVLANRIYRNPDLQSLYLDRLAALLDGPWDEARLTARLEAMEALLLPELEDGGETLAAMEEVRSAILARREAIEAELHPSVRWPFAPRESYCFVEDGAAVLSFQTWWGSLLTEDPFSSGVADISVEWEDGTLPILQSGVVAGSSEGVGVLYAAAWISAHEAIVVYFTAPETDWQPGTVALDLGTRVGGLFYIDVDTMEDFTLLSYIVGDMHFEEAGTTLGDPLVGRLDGMLLVWG